MLTVLIATYNHKPYFKEAIESVLAQETNFDFQIYILDDASNDGTSDIVREYAQKYPDKIVPFIRDKNLGTIENFYQGIKSVKTKYFALLEGDDFWCSPNKLQKQVDALEKNLDCSFCGHDTRVNNPQNCSASIKSGELISSYFQKVKGNKIGTKNKFSVHTSSRVFRTNVINFEKLKHKESIVFDYCSYWYFISKGKLFYIDEVMSEYNCTGKGWFSSLSIPKRNEMFLNSISHIDEELGYKYSHIFDKDLRTCVTGKIFLKFKAREVFLNRDKAYNYVLAKIRKNNNMMEANKQIK